jgi:hypothetical protein
LHYNWHLNSRLTDIAREKASRAAAAEHRSAAIAKAKERAVEGAEVDAASRDVKGNLRTKRAKIEERVMSRMNRKWVSHALPTIRTN